MDENGVRRRAWEHLDLDGKVETIGDKVDALIHDQRGRGGRLAENTAMVEALDARVEVLATDAMRELGAISRKLAEVADDNAKARARQDSITDEHEVEITQTRKAVVVLSESDEVLHEKVARATRLARLKVGLLVALIVPCWELCKWLAPLLK